jgi:hypothetical protein
VIWTSPSRHTYRTLSGSKLLVRALCVPTGELPLPHTRGAECGNPGAMMPKRKRPRATERLRRIMAERNENQRGIATR